MRDFLIKHDLEKSCRWHVSSIISIIHDGRLILIVSVLLLSLVIYTSKKENALRIWSGVAFFHCSIFFAGKSSANFAAIGHDTLRFPVMVKFMVGWLNPNRFDICSCVIMAAIFSYNMQYVKQFIAVYNKTLQHAVNIANYSLVFAIKGGVL